jgi:hypothetical protein
MSDGLIARLRKFPMFYLNGAHWMNSGQPDPLCTEAADTLSAQQQEIERLRKALSHIRWIKDCGIDSVNDAGLLHNHPDEERDAMYRIARAALATPTDTPKEPTE